MPHRRASCGCGKLRIETSGDSVRILGVSLPRKPVADGVCADPQFPAPKVSVVEVSRHDWVSIGGDLEHSD